MKKAKIILSAVAVFAVIGGAFAFKARSTQFIFTRLNPAVNACTVKVTGVTLSTIDPNADPIGTTFATTVSGTCPVALPYYSGL